MPSTPTEAKTLTPCPFCGTTEGLYPSYRWPGTGKPYAVDCVGCGIDFVPREGLDVIAAWNRRTVDPSLLSLIEDMAKALEPFADVAQYILAEAPADATMWQAFVSSDGNTAQISLEYLRDARSALSRYTEFMEQNNA